MPISKRSSPFRELSYTDQPAAYLFNYCAGVAEKYEKEEDQENQSIFLKKMLTLFYLDQNQNHSLLIKCLYKLSVISIDNGNSKSGFEYLKLLTSSSNEIEELADAKIIYEAHDKIASIYQDYGELTYAIHHLEVALFIARQLFGDYSHQVINYHSELGNLYLNINHEFVESASIYHFEEALSIGRVLYKNDHKWISDLCIDIGSSYKENNRFEEAIPKFKEALNRTKILFGNKSEESMNPRINLAHLYILESKPKKSLAYLENALITKSITIFNLLQTNCTPNELYSPIKEIVDIYKTFRFAYGKIHSPGSEENHNKYNNKALAITKKWNDAIHKKFSANAVEAFIIEEDNQCAEEDITPQTNILEFNENNDIIPSTPCLGTQDVSDVCYHTCIIS